MSESKWIEIARTGTFNDSANRPQTFTDTDLARIASAYNPQKRDCPLVIGHVTSDSAPAYGWLSQIKAQNGKLLAQFAHVPDEVRDLVAKGRYRHVSMSLMPDRVTLRHVALLGAAQPAIDGLKAVELRAGDTDITVDFSTQPKEHTMSEDLQREIGALKERLAALEKENASLKAENKTHKESKDKAEGEKKEAEAKAEKTASDFAAYREKVESEKLEARVSELVRAGKITPAEKQGILDFASRLDNQSDSIDFAATRAFPSHEGKTEKVSMREHYLRGLEAKSPDPRGVNFSAPPLHSLEGQAGSARVNDINPAELTAKL